MKQTFYTHKQVIVLQVVTALLAVLIMIATGLVSAQSMLPAAYLPIVFGAAPSGAPATLITLDQGDNSFVAAAYDATGRRFVSYIDRDNGNLLHVAEDKGTTLVELPLPPEIASQIVLTPLNTSADPAFVFPGAKQAASAMYIQNQRIVLYVTSRDPDDDSGKFKLKRLELDIPAPTP